MKLSPSAGRDTCPLPSPETPPYHNSCQPPQIFPQPGQQTGARPGWDRMRENGGHIKNLRFNPANPGSVKPLTGQNVHECPVMSGKIKNQGLRTGVKQLRAISKYPFPL